MTRAVIFTGNANTEGKRDYTGAFRPEADRFAALCRARGFDVSTHALDLGASKAAQRSSTAAALGLGGGIGLAAWVCHGWRTGIQLGYSSAQLGELAAALRDGGASEDVTVALYCCSTAAGPGRDGDGGFADGLRDALCAAGLRRCRVLAHDRAGHTTRNPYAREFVGAGSPVGGTGGTWVVAPGSTLWRPWVRALAGTGDLRFRMALQTTAETHAELVPATTTGGVV